MVNPKLIIESAVRTQAISVRSAAIPVRLIASRSIVRRSPDLILTSGHRADAAQKRPPRTRCLSPGGWLDQDPESSPRFSASVSSRHPEPRIVEIGIELDLLDRDDHLLRPVLGLSDD